MRRLLNHYRQWREKKKEENYNLLIQFWLDPTDFMRRKFPNDQGRDGEGVPGMEEARGR